MESLVLMYILSRLDMAKITIIGWVKTNEMSKFLKIMIITNLLTGTLCMLVGVRLQHVMVLESS